MIAAILLSVVSKLNYCQYPTKGKCTPKTIFFRELRWVCWMVIARNAKNFADILQEKA